MYIVSPLLRNALTCINGNQTSVFFLTWIPQPLKSVLFRIHQVTIRHYELKSTDFHGPKSKVVLNHMTTKLKEKQKQQCSKPYHCNTTYQTDVSNVTDMCNGKTQQFL